MGPGVVAGGAEPLRETYAHATYFDAGRGAILVAGHRVDSFGDHVDGHPFPLRLLMAGREQTEAHPWRRPYTAKGVENGPRPVGRRKGSTGSPEVDNTALREAFERSGLSKCEVARRLGWIKHSPNVGLLNVTLGYAPHHGKMRRRITYQTAVKLCSVLGADPWEVGV